MPGYLADRRSKRIFQHAIARRVEALSRQLQRWGYLAGNLPEGGLVLDVGTADGLVLEQLQQRLGFRGIGVDVRMDHLAAARGRIERLIQADGRALPLATESVDVVLSTAVFKHVLGLDQLVAECVRVLRPGGRLLVIDPTPLGIRLGIWLGHLPRDSVFQVLGLAELEQLLCGHGLAVTIRERFMLSPLPFPGSRALERLVKKAGGERLLLNQLVVGEKREPEKIPG